MHCSFGSSCCKLTGNKWTVIVESVGLLFSHSAINWANRSCGAPSIRYLSKSDWGHCLSLSSHKEFQYVWPLCAEYDKWISICLNCKQTRTLSHSSAAWVDYFGIWSFLMRNRRRLAYLMSSLIKSGLIVNTAQVFKYFTPNLWHGERRSNESSPW